MLAFIQLGAVVRFYAMDIVVIIFVAIEDIDTDISKAASSGHSSEFTNSNRFSRSNCLLLIHQCLPVLRIWHQSH
jgi:hypothetical protein